jgi:outer membrane lipoprotein-sorting protein
MLRAPHVGFTTLHQPAARQRRSKEKPMATLRILLLTLLACLLLPASALAKDKLTAREILDKVDDTYRGRSARGQMRMKVVNPNYKRELVMDFWSHGKEKSLVRIVEPKKERRTATLKNGNNIWNYLPKVNRTIKIPSSMMGGSWMGSDFTNDDLVKEHRMADDYAPKITFDGSRGGQKVIEITCTPKPNAPVVWGKLVVTVRAQDYLPVRIDYHKERGGLARRLTFSNYEQLGGRLVPTTMTMIPRDKPGHSTVVTYEKLTFDVSLPANLFTVASLRSGR